jgi:hypothetical protein
MPDSILDRLEGIFSVWLNTTQNFSVQAEHYGNSVAVEILTPEEMRQLGHELIAMADEAQPDPSEAEMHDWRTHPALTSEQRNGV